MWCLSNKVIKTDEDPPRDKPKKSILKRMKDKVKKWVKKPKKAAQNPINEPLYGRRNEMTLDLSQPLPFSNVINGLHSDLPKNLPTDPKKTIIFTTSSSKFMKIEEVGHGPYEGIRIGSQGHRRQIGHRLTPKMIEYKKMEESLSNEMDLNRYLGKDSNYDSESDHSSPSQSVRAIQDGTLIVRVNGLAFRPIERDKGKEKDIDRYVGKGKEIIVEFPDESDSDSDSIQDDSGPSNCIRAIHEGILIDEIPIEEFSREATIESGTLIEEIPIEEFSRDASEEIPTEDGTEIEEISQVMDASMRQLVPYRRIYLSFDILKFHISQIVAGLPPCFIDPFIGQSELPYALQVTNSQKYLRKRKGDCAIQLCGSIKICQTDSGCSPAAGWHTGREKGKGIVQNESDSDSDIKMKESEGIEQGIMMEEVPVGEFSQERNEAAIITHSEEPAHHVQPISYSGPIVCSFDFLLGSTVLKNHLSQLVPGGVPPRFSDLSEELEEGQRAWISHRKEAALFELQLESETAHKLRAKTEEFEAKMRALREEHSLALQRIEQEHTNRLLEFRRDEQNVAQLWANKHARLSRFKDQTIMMN